MEHYEIVFAPTAYEDLECALKWLSENVPEKVAEWYAAIKSTIQTLSTFPERCPYAPENGLWGDEVLRQLFFHDYPSKYRIIFTVRRDSVQILNIRHGARKFMHEE